MEQRVGQAHPLAVALRQRPDQFLLHIPQVAEFFYRIDPLAVAPPAHALEGRPVFEVFLHPHFGVKSHIFRHVADPRAHLARLAGHVEPGHACSPARGGQIARQDPHRRAFPCPVGTEKTDDFALLDREIQVIHRRDTGIFLGQSFNLDHSAQACSFLRDRAERAYMARFGGAGKLACRLPANIKIPHGPRLCVARRAGSGDSPRSTHP